MEREDAQPSRKREQKTLHRHKTKHQKTLNHNKRNEQQLDHDNHDKEGNAEANPKQIHSDLSALDAGTNKIELPRE